jgi:hypothetical protein
MAVGVQSGHPAVDSTRSPVPAMHTARRAALLWSGGKDSVLALYHVCKSLPDL